MSETNSRYAYEFVKDYDFHCTVFQKHQFFVMPRAVFEVEPYQQIYLEAKVIYGMMLDRTLDWTQNPFHIGKQFVDETGHVFITFSPAEATKLVNCSETRVKKFVRQLLDFGVIVEGKNPSEYYVLYIPDMLDFINC